MAAALNADDLNFAKVRARYLEPPEQVAADLVEAVSHPERLEWVSATAVLVTAADVLTRAGDYEPAVLMLRRILDNEMPDRQLAILARTVLAKALIGTGDVDGAEALFLTASGMAGPLDIAPLVTGVQSFAEAGYYEHAWRCANEIEALAVRLWRRGNPVLVALLDRRRAPSEVLPYLDIAQTAREKIQKVKVRDRTQTRGTRESSARNAEDGRASTPSHVTLWWPEADYLRLDRQLPDLTAMIGSPWHQHVTQIEASLRDRARHGQHRQRLLRATFDDFVGFLMASNVNPRSRAALDEFAAPGRPTGDWLASPWATFNLTTEPWPPRPNKKCWCDSGRSYEDCCGALAG